jgi:hypothetical protein
MPWVQAQCQAPAGRDRDIEFGPASAAAQVFRPIEQAEVAWSNHLAEGFDMLLSFGDSLFNRCKRRPLFVEI